ncbi:D-serine ammonia-lyase [Vibrio sp. MA40-2]|uniref:D-serine ammonia-lyase n=1 Tax=Vibrio sp. MA40-2 TaxID=3391828 RepID=UPI0039A6BF50
MSVNTPEGLKNAKVFANQESVVAGKECFWLNSEKISFEEARQLIDLTAAEEIDAAQRLDRFAPYIATVFPETKAAHGRIESAVVDAPDMQAAIESLFGFPAVGRLMIKLDCDLPISGSIKARGGIYEVLKHAETLAIENGLLSDDDDYSIFASEKYRQFFRHYSLVVGSTGNLGMSIGIMGACLGLNVSVHMSADARQWKKDLLRSKGVTVIEHSDDYGCAVIEGRNEASNNPNCHFVDDEDSIDLFLGYSVAARRLKQQLAEQNVQIDSDHPLFVYLPCGVGGGPGGVSFGLKLVFGDAVRCIFVEPTQAPAVLVGLGSGMDEHVSAKDYGLEGKTIADGLAVSRPSGLVCRLMRPLIDGVVTVDDARLHPYLALAWDTENIKLEPSATAGFFGYCKATQSSDYLTSEKLAKVMKNSTHIVWATGGRMVPKQEWERYYDNGKKHLSVNR